MKFVAQAVQKLWPKVWNRKWNFNFAILLILPPTVNPDTKYEVSSSNRSKVIGKSVKPKVKLKIFHFFKSSSYSGLTYQIWSFYHKRFKSYDQKSETESETKSFAFFFYSTAHSGPAYQIWSFSLQRFKSYGQKSKTEKKRFFWIVRPIFGPIFGGGGLAATHPWHSYGRQSQEKNFAVVRTPKFHQTAEICPKNHYTQVRNLLLLRSTLFTLLRLSSFPRPLFYCFRRFVGTRGIWLM